MSDEAQREDRSLRVAHTVLGLDSPLNENQTPTVPAPSQPPLAPVYDPGLDPVTLPISGWPPAAVGVLVLGVMAAAAVAGYLVFH